MHHLRHRASHPSTFQHSHAVSCLLSPQHEHAAALAPAVEARLAQRVSCLSAAWTGVGGSSSSGPDAAGPTDSWRSLANLGPAPSSKLPQMWSQGQSQQGGQRGSSRPGMEGSDDAGLGPGSLAVLVAERQAALQVGRHWGAQLACSLLISSTKTSPYSHPHKASPHIKLTKA